MSAADRRLNPIVYSPYAKLKWPVCGHESGVELLTHPFLSKYVHLPKHWPLSFTQLHYHLYDNILYIIKLSLTVGTARLDTWWSFLYQSINSPFSKSIWSPSTVLLYDCNVHLMKLTFILSVDCMPYSLSLPGLWVSLCLFLQAFLWGHRTGSQLIRHCICTKSHFYIIGYHKAVNATIRLKSLYIILPLPHFEGQPPLIWSAEFIIYFLFVLVFSQKKQTIRFLIPCFESSWRF